jgi:hypothetical protein
MNYRRRSRLPESLRHKILGWGLPRNVLISFLTMIHDKLDKFPPSSSKTIAKPCEHSSTCLKTGVGYSFYGRIAAQRSSVDGELTIVDIDFDLMRDCD